jgi:uncharacterized membrane protein YesL
MQQLLLLFIYKKEASPSTRRFLSAWRRAFACRSACGFSFRLYFLVLNYKVFSRKQSGKVGLDFVIDGHRFNFL